MRQFCVGGVSRNTEGQVKVRFATDISRVKVYVKDKHTDIELLEMPGFMDKKDIVKELLKSHLMDNPDFAEAIQTADEKYNPVPKAPKVKVEKVKKPRKAKAEKPELSLEAIKARGKSAKAEQESTDQPEVPAE